MSTKKQKPEAGKPSGAKYVGEDPCPVRADDRVIARKGEIVWGSGPVVEELLGRADFEAVFGEPSKQIESKPADEPVKE